MGLDALSSVAAYSKYHFHRQFTATFVLSVHHYIQLARMKHASYRLAHRDAQSVTDVAMDAGYDGPDAFVHDHPTTTVHANERQFLAPPTFTSRSKAT